MSDPPVSGSPYIIICNGRIGVKLAKSTDEKIRAASQCANDLCLYMGMRYRQTLDPADLHPLSVVQHWLMDSLDAKKGANANTSDVEAKVDELFDLMEALEEKYTGHAY